MQYIKFSVFRRNPPSNLVLQKQVLREILSLAESDRERELIRYTAFVSGQFSQTSARFRQYEAPYCWDWKEAKEIREAIDEIAMVEIRSLAINYGLSGSEDECDWFRCWSWLMN